MRKETRQEVHRNEDEFYEDLIPRLYKPARKVMEVIAQELPFEVEAAPEPEPAPAPIPAPAPEPEPATAPVVEEDTELEDEDEPEVEAEPKVKDEPEEPTMLSKWKVWLNNLMKEVTE